MTESQQEFIGERTDFGGEFAWNEDFYGQNNQDWYVSGQYWTEIDEESQSKLRMKGTLDGPSDNLRDGSSTLLIAMGNMEKTLWLFSSLNTIQSGQEPRSIIET